MRRFRSVAIVSPVLAVCALLTTSAHAEPSNTDQASGSPTPDASSLDADELAFPDYYDGISDIATAIDSAMKDYPDVYGGLRFEPDAISLVVKVFEGSDPSRSAAAHAALDAIPLTHGISMRTEPSGFALAEREAVMDTIVADLNGWSDRLGADVLTVHVDDDTGDVVVGIDGLMTPKTPVTTEAGVPVVVLPATVESQAGSRRSDRGNWTGGNWLGRSADPTGIAACTLGFSWRRWGISGTWGGIAKHCPVNSGSIQWYHDGRRLGDYVLGDPASDAAILRPETGTAFNPSVWVGPQNTEVERIVVGANPAPVVGTDVALSGANSGLHTYTIVDASVYVTGLGYLVTTDDEFCVPGDSGGPWLTTQSTPPNNVIAHGQHFGELTIGSGPIQCSYLPVHRISASLEASILTG